MALVSACSLIRLSSRARRLSAPAYGALFHHESRNPATAKMPLSQRLIHTRVYGQAMVIGITVAIVSFGKSMEELGGRYLVHEGRVVREAEVSGRQRQWYETDELTSKLGARIARVCSVKADSVANRLWRPSPAILIAGLKKSYAGVCSLSANLMTWLRSCARVLVSVYQRPALH